MIVAESEPARWQCTFSNGTVESTADTTGDHGGGETGIRPHELLEAALATCLNMTVRMAAAERGAELDGVTTTVDLDRDCEEPTVAYAIDIVGVEEQIEDDLRAVADGCPVHETLSAELEFEERPSLAE